MTISLDRKGAVSSNIRGPDLKIFIKDVRDRQQRKRAITIRSWSTIQEVKHVIQKIMHVPPNAQRLYFGPLLSSGKELPNHRTLHDAGIYRSGETLLLDIKASSSAASSVYSTHLRASETGNDVCISSSMIDATPKILRSLVQKARRGFLMGLKPEFVLDGSGGTYFLHDAKKTKIAVFKPADEEPYASNNPRGYLRQPGQTMALREGVAPGEACMREVAAYLLDHDGFSGVPMTTLAEARHPAFNNNGSRLKVAEGGASIGAHSISSPLSNLGSSASLEKVGSFQEFCSCECTIDDMSPSKISVDEVHKIAILDIRIMNADRNSANLLVRRRRDNSLELVPIDHGFCLRSVADVSWMDWCWLDWPQLKQPLSEASKRYILNLDIEADARILLEQLNLSQAAVDIFRASTTILQAGVRAGLTLYEIAIMCCRNDDLGEIPSKLEILFNMAEELSLSALENGRWHHSAASRALADQLTPRVNAQALQRRSSVSSGSTANSNCIPKSASSVHFKSMLSDLDVSMHDEDAKKDFPGMTGTQSSASDSSSETDEAVQEDNEDFVDEWAASKVASVNMSMDQSMSMIAKEGRSSSIGSEDDSTDGSPKGFWQTRPGSPSAAAGEDDVSWTLSPESSPTLTLAVPASAFPLLPKCSSVNETEGQKARQTNRASFRSPTVTFAEDPWMNKELEVPSSSLSEQHSNTPKTSLSALPKMEGMKRSQSYSAISALNATSVKSVLSMSATRPTDSHPDPFTEEFDQYRDYFLKFVQLVIEREITAAQATTAQSQQQQIDHVSG